MNCWEILGIEPTVNRKNIQLAYIQLVKNYSPEADTEQFQQIEKAYQQALDWSIENLANEGHQANVIEHVEQPSTDHLSAEHAIEQVMTRKTNETETQVTNEQGSVQVAETKSKWAKNLLQYAFWVVLILGGMHLASNNMQVEQTSSELVQEIRYEPYWDTDLEICNKIDKPDTDSAFDECLELAQNGRVYAQMRVAWLFFESEEEGHMQESFKWMSKAGNYLDEPLLLSKIMLLTYGTSDKDKHSGYKGIVRLSDKGNSAADAYLALLYYLQLNLADRMANPLWLLEKAYHKGDGYVSPMDLVKIYINGIDTKVNVNKANSVLKNYANGNFPHSANNAAWFIATTANLDIIPPHYAVELAESIVADTRYQSSYVYLDTLAATYAAVGEFEKAVKEQTRAIELLEKSNTESQEQNLEQFHSRLEEFKQEQLPQYDNVIVEKTALFTEMKNGLEQALLNSLRYATYQ